MTDDDAEPPAVAEAADQLYAAAPEEFMALRSELSKQAKADGDAAAAKVIGALRKPTAGAAIVNRYALAEPDALQPLVEIGDDLRRAQHDLDAKAMRELSTRRRSTVADVAKAALDHAGRGEPTTALRDEVTATFDAAVADPDVAARLGRLVRGEQFSGFGVEPGPGLTLVQGGKDRPEKKPAKKQTEKPKPEPAAPRRLTRRAEKARDEFESADERHTAAEQSEQRASERVKTLTAELAELQDDLDTAKRELDVARRETRTARGKRREARSALDRAERALERGE